MSQDNFFREVDEELRSDRVRKLWRRFAPYVLGAAIAVVLVVAVNEGWAWWQNSNSARSSDEFYSALEKADAGDFAGAQAELEVIATQGNGGYPTLARFRSASLLAKNGDIAGASSAYDALANDLANPRLRDLAFMLSANLLVDNGDVAAVQSRLGGIAVDGNPLRNSAREAIGLTQYKAGDLQGARATFESITADANASQNVSQRIQIYLAQLAAEGAAVPAEDAEAGTEPAEPAAETAPAAETPAVTEAPAPAAETPAMAPATEAPAMAPAPEATPMSAAPPAMAPAAPVEGQPATN